MAVLRAPLLREAVADALTEMITKGELAPGQRLQETALCEQLGVSRSPLREAFRALEAQGLIQIEPRRGAVVATMDAQDFKDLFDCRLLVQPELVRLSVGEIGDSQINELEAIVARLARAEADGRVFEFLTEVKQFLEVVIDVCPNRTLAELVKGLSIRGMRFRAVGQRQPHQMTRSLKDHHTLLTCIRDGDSLRAMETMIRMLTASRAAVIGALMTHQEST